MLLLYIFYVIYIQSLLDTQLFDLKYSLTRYVISVSNKFLTWDLASSEICRDVDPHLEGLMLGLAVSPDYRHAAAHTSTQRYAQAALAERQQRRPRL